MATSTHQKSKEIPDLSLLLTLDSKLWSVGNKGQQSNNRSIGEYHIEVEGAHITAKQWKDVKKLIDIHSLICTPGSGVFGFGRSISFYQQPEPAPFPGTEGTFKPEYLLCLTNKHMENILKGTTPTEDYDRWWDEMQPLVYSEKNRALINKHMKEPLREKSYYEY